MRNRSSGFTLLEALVAGVITAVGVGAALRAIGAMEKRQAVVNDQQTELRLAKQKFDEILAIQDFNTPSGDFTDHSDTAHLWQMELNPVSLPVTNTANSSSSTTTATVNTGNQGEIEMLTVTVHPSDQNSPTGAQSVSGLVWVSQQSLNGTSGAAQ